MGALDIIRWSLKQIKSRLLESVLIILGIGLGIAVISSVIGLVQGFEKEMTRFEVYNNNILTIHPIQSSWGGGMSDRALTPMGKVKDGLKKLTYEDFQSLKQADIDSLDLVWIFNRTGYVKDGADFQNQGETQEEREKWQRENVITFGVTTPEVFQLTENSLVAGNYFLEKDVVEKNKVMVLGEKMAEQEFPNQDPIGQTYQYEDNIFTIIGVVSFETSETMNSEENRSDDYIRGLGQKSELNYWAYIPYGTLQFEYNSRMNEIREFYAKPKEGVGMDSFYSDMKRYIEEKYDGMVVIDGYYQTDVKSRVLAQGKAIGLFASIALLIAAINILNLMLARVMKRYKNIGISAALGSSKANVFTLFMTEAIILGLIGSILGIGLGYGAVALLGKLLGYMQLEVTILNWVASLGIAFLISLLFGLYPARQAAQIDPVDALRID